MDFLKFIEKLGSDKKFSGTFFIALFDIIFLISPGILILFIFSNKYFLEMDTIKLILLSISITGSLSLLNSVLIIDSMKKMKDKSSVLIIFSLGILMTGIIFFLSIVFAFFLSSFSVRSINPVYIWLVTTRSIEFVFPWFILLLALSELGFMYLLNRKK